MVAGWRSSGARKALDQARSELEAEGTAVPPVKVGIMIEIPAAAAMAPLLAAEADFFSVGTNDLTQYTLAADRMNARVTRWYDSFHPGVLQLLRLTAEGAGKRNIELGMCGEMAGDLDAIPLLLGLGFPGTLHDPLPDPLGETARAGALHRSLPGHRPEGARLRHGGGGSDVPAGAENSPYRGFADE
jgi:signal transduction protein with GAF and PtsI domain